MRGYPKYIASKRDYLNLLNMKEFKARAAKDLERIYHAPDDKIRKTIAPLDPSNLMGEWKVMEVKNPMPKWKRLGFKSRDEILSIISTEGGHIDVK